MSEKTRPAKWALPAAVGVFTLLALGVFSGAASAASIDWRNTSGDGNYNNPANWSTGVVPVGGDDAVFVDTTVGPANISADTPVPRDFRFGDDNRTGGGVVNHTAGTATLGGWFRMGINNASTGTYNLSGTGVLNSSGRLNIAEATNTTGNFNQTGGTVNFGLGGQNQGMWLAVADGATGNYTLNNGLLKQGDVGDPTNGDSWNRIGNGNLAKANFNLSGGTASFDGRTLMAGAAGTTSIVTHTAGTFEVRHGEFVIGDQAVATYNISSGTLRTLNPENGNPDTSGHITIGQWDNSNGTLNVSGNALVSAADNLQLADGRVDFPNAGTVNQTSGTVRVGVAGVGNLTLARTASGTAVYNLMGGTLDLTGGDIIKGDGNATFNMTGGRLQSAHNVNIPLTVGGGTLAPAGTKTLVSAALTLSAGSTYEVLLNGNTPVTQYDQIGATGPITIAGNLSVIPGFLPNQGDQFLIIDNQGTGPIIGQFANAPGGIYAVGAMQFSVNYAGGDGNDVVLTTTVVPEPSILCLSGLALAGATILRRRHGRRA